eukprot:2129047-Prymnesium_polylepis.1
MGLRKLHRVAVAVVARDLEHVDKPALGAPDVQDGAFGVGPARQLRVRGCIIVKAYGQRRRQALRRVALARVVVPHPAAGRGVAAKVVAHRAVRRLVARPRRAAPAVTVGVRVVAVPHGGVVLAGTAVRQAHPVVAVDQVAIDDGRLADAGDILVPPLH